MRPMGLAPRGPLGRKLASDQDDKLDEVLGREGHSVPYTMSLTDHGKPPRGRQGLMASCSQRCENKGTYHWGRCVQGAVGPPLTVLAGHCDSFSPRDRSRDRSRTGQQWTLPCSYLTLRIFAFSSRCLRISCVPFPIALSLLKTRVHSRHFPLQRRESVL
jgi:hypothetical protein